MRFFFTAVLIYTSIYVHADEADDERYRKLESRVEDLHKLINFIDMEYRTAFEWLGEEVQSLKDVVKEKFLKPQSS